MNKTNSKASYEAPRVEIYTYAAERGFAASASLTAYDDNDPLLPPDERRIELYTERDWTEINSTSFWD